MYRSPETDVMGIMERDGQSRKQFSQRSRTESGMQIDESAEQPENASLPIHKTFETDSNVTVERD
jgi:hypothetical protein